MCRTLLVLVAMAAGGAATGDVLKIPQLVKAVPVEHTVTTDKDYPAYDFYLAQEETTAVVVKFDSKTPLKFTGKSTGPDFVLVAVPVGARKKYKTDKEFEAAVAAVRAEGAVRAERYLNSWILVPVGDKREIVAEVHKVAKIDAKDGIELADVNPEPNKKGDKKGPPDAPPRGASVIISGVAAFAGVTLGGFWLAGRTRRGVTR